jgi:ribonucleotide reductase alpha subunit
MSARESPAEAAARRAALQQKFGGTGGAGASSLRRSVDGSATSRLHSSGTTSLRRLPSAASEASSSGSLNSARGLRASTSQIATAGGRGRWA